MDSTNKTIAKNASILMGSQLITWTLTLLFTMFLPRYLGAVGVGKIHFANSVWAIVGIISAFGMDTLLTKEIARNPSKVSELFGLSILLRMFLFALAYSATIALLYLANYSLDTIYVAGIIGIAYLVMLFIEGCKAVLKGVEQMDVMSLGDIIGHAILTIVGILMLLWGWRIYTIAALIIVAKIANFALLLSSLRRTFSLRLHFDWQSAIHMLRSGIPYLMSGAILVIYLRIDIVIISFIVDERAVGWYGVADQLFSTFMFVPTVFLMAMFPAMSRMHMTDKASLHKLMTKSFDSLLLVSVPIGLGVMIIADPIVVLLFGSEFVNSGPILAVMGIVLIFTYQNVLLGRFLTAIDRQNAWTLVMMTATLATIPLDLFFIPWSQTMFNNGAIGGALSYVVTETMMISIGLILLPSGILGRRNVWTAVRVMAAGLAMVAVVWWFREMVIIIPIALGAIIYVSSVLLMGIVPKDDLASLMAFAQRLVGRLNRHEAKTVSG